MKNVAIYFEYLLYSLGAVESTAWQTGRVTSQCPAAPGTPVMPLTMTAGRRSLPLFCFFTVKSWGFENYVLVKNDDVSHESLGSKQK